MLFFILFTALLFYFYTQVYHIAITHFQDFQLGLFCNPRSSSIGMASLNAVLRAHIW